MKKLEPRLLADDFIFLEAPRWHEGQLWVPDVFASILYRIDVNGRKTIEIENLPPFPNSIGFLPDGSLLVISSADRRILRFVDGKSDTYADLSTACAHHLNDFVVDEDGRIYVGNFGYDIHAGAPEQPTCLHMIDTDRSIRVAATDLEFPNGAVIINDGRTLVVAETWVGRLTAFDRAKDGSLSNRRLYADLGGRQPDGICADAEGGVWACAFNTGEVIRVLDGGQITHHMQFEGSSAIACQLGGEDGRTLFCTTYAGTIQDQLEQKRKGALYQTRVDVTRPQ